MTSVNPQKPGHPSWEDDVRRRLRARPQAPDQAPPAAPAHPDPATLDPATLDPEGAAETPAERHTPAGDPAPEREGALRAPDFRAEEKLRQRVSRRRGERWWEQAWRRTRALVTSDDAPGRLTSAAEDVQRPVTTARRIVVVGACGGAGATSAAALVACVVAHLRRDGVAVIAEPGDRGALAGALGLEEVCTVTAALEAATAADPDDVLAGGGVGRPYAVTVADASEEAVAALADRLGRRHAVVITDAGTSGGHPAAPLAHIVLLVVPPSLPGLAAARSTLADLEAAGVHRDRVLAVVVETGRDAGVSTRTARRALGELQLDLDVAVLPADRHVGGGTRIDLDRLSQRCSVAVWELAALGLQRATRP